MYGLYGLIIFAIAPLVVSHGIIGLILSVIMIVRFVKAVKLNVEYAEYKKRIQ